MSFLATFFSPVNPYSAADEAEAGTLAQIDRSLKAPGLLFLVSAALWLGAGTVLSLAASIQSTHGDFLACYEWFTFGRSSAAAYTALVYGWASNAIFAVAFWIMARLCRGGIRYPGILVMAGCFWNLSITIGVIGIFAGDLTGAPGLDLPGYATPLALLAFALVGVWGLITFHYRAVSEVYVSQWYLLAALFWFPWIFTVAQVMVLWVPARGTVQSVAAAWFAYNVFGLWLAPVALAAIYYFIPKILGTPIKHYYLAVLGFWFFALFSGWIGSSDLVGGPVPAWVVTVGAVAAGMMVLPGVIIAINFFATLRGHLADIRGSTTLQFIVPGAIGFVALLLITAYSSQRGASSLLQLTHFTEGEFFHGLYLFFSLVMFGAIYFILPRLTRREWPSELLVRTHLCCALAGALLVVLGLYLGGAIQGSQLNALTADGTPVFSFVEVSRNIRMWLSLRTIGLLVLLVGHTAFAINLLWMAVGVRALRPTSEAAPAPAVPQNA